MKVENLKPGPNFTEVSQAVLSLTIYYVGFSNATYIVCVNGNCLGVHQLSNWLNLMYINKSFDARYVQRAPSVFKMK